MFLISRLPLPTLFSLVLASTFVVNAQSPAPTLSSSSPKDCRAFTLQTVETLTLKQRACFAGKQLISPQFALAAGIASAYGQFLDSPHIYHTGLAEFQRRYEIHYAYRGARTTAELIVGYLHNEDPRFRRSIAHGFWRRTNSSIRNVLISPDADGNARVAYAPIAGAFGSAFTASMLYRHSETLPNTLEHAAAVYSFYFVRSFYQEFKPEFTTYARHFLHLQ